MHDAIELKVWYNFRYWNPVPPTNHGTGELYPHIRSSDGTYRASEFNYSLPRQRKGYDTVGYKHPSQSDPRFMGTFPLFFEKERGYNSDHTYESPMCELVYKGEHCTTGKPVVNLKDVDSQVALCQDTICDRTGDPNVKPSPILPLNGINGIRSVVQ